MRFTKRIFVQHSGIAIHQRVFRHDLHTLHDDDEEQEERDDGKEREDQPMSPWRYDRRCDVLKQQSIESEKDSAFSLLSRQFALLGRTKTAGNM